MATPPLDLQPLIDALAEDKDVNRSAITLIQKLLADVEANAGNQAKIQEIVDTYRAQTAELAAAVATT